MSQPHCRGVRVSLACTLSLYLVLLSAPPPAAAQLSGALAADLTLFEGTWSGNWRRTSGPEQGSSGALDTTFTVHHDRLEGTHYGIKMEKVVVEGRVVQFEHPYGGCRASHTFTVDLNDHRRAQSEYHVTRCGDPAQDHTGEITYTKTR
jgi:hypothetical protein